MLSNIQIMRIPTLIFNILIPNTVKNISTQILKINLQFKAPEPKTQPFEVFQGVIFEINELFPEKVLLSYN